MPLLLQQFAFGKFMIYACKHLRLLIVVCVLGMHFEEVFHRYQGELLVFVTEQEQLAFQLQSELHQPSLLVRIARGNLASEMPLLVIQVLELQM